MHADWCYEREWNSAWLLLIVDLQLTLRGGGDRGTFLTQPPGLPYENTPIATQLRNDGFIVGWHHNAYCY
jgi:hypothetical protein